MMAIRSHCTAQRVIIYSRLDIHKTDYTDISIFIVPLELKFPLTDETNDDVGNAEHQESILNPVFVRPQCPS